MKRLYFDWSGTKGIHTIDDDTELPTNEEEKKDGRVKIYNDFNELFIDLTEPTQLIGEATFESFLPSRRKKVIETAKAFGHEILTTPTRETGRRRRKLELKKSDYIDPFVIRDLANDGKTHLKKPSFVDQNWVEISKQANHELMIMRNTKIQVGSKRIGLKDYFAQLIIRYIPKLEGCSEKTRLVLGDGEKKYSLTAVAAVAIATRYVNNTREFDKLCGLYHNGYPCQIRADLYHHRWGRRFTDINGKNKKNYGKITLTDFRREIRRLYHWIVEKVEWKYIDNEMKLHMEESEKMLEKEIKHIKHVSNSELFDTFFK